MYSVICMRVHLVCVHIDNLTHGLHIRSINQGFIQGGEVALDLGKLFIKV